MGSGDLLGGGLDLFGGTARENGAHLSGLDWNGTPTAWRFPIKEKLLEEEVDWLGVDLGKVLQLNHVNSPLSAFGLGDK